MRKTWTRIGYAAVLWGMTVFTPVWGQPVVQGAEMGQPGGARGTGLEESGGDPAGAGGERGRPEIGKPPGRGQEKIPLRERREKVRKRIEMMRMVRMTEELGLDEETATRLFARLRPIEQERWKLIRERRTTHRDLNRASNSEKTDTGELKNLMTLMEKNEAALSELEKKEGAVVKSLLNPRQQAKYLVFKDRFRKEMKDRIQKARNSKPSHQPLSRGEKGPSSP